MKSLVIRLLRTIRTWPSAVVVGLIRLYQLVVSPLLGPRCKFAPSCSDYGLEAVRVHGAFVGSLLAAWRIVRCNPWSVGGVDDVPALGERRFRLHRNNGAVAAPASNHHSGEHALVR